MQNRPPWLPTGGTGVLMLLVLLFVIAALAFIAWRDSSTSAPSPASTAIPKELPPPAR